MNQRKKVNNFIQKHEDLKSGEYQVVGEYINKDKPCIFRHSVCGYEWIQNANNKRVCPECFKKGVFFSEKVEQLKNEEYVLLSTFEGSNKRIRVKHVSCGHEYDVIATFFAKGYTCQYCKYKKKFFNHPPIKTGEYKVLGTFKNMKSRIKLKCSKCLYEWETVPSGMLSKKSGCPSCARGGFVDKRSFADKEEDISSGKYKVNGTYINYNTPLEFEHAECGHKWKTTPKVFHQGARCPICASRDRKVASKDEFYRNMKNINGGAYELVGEFVDFETKIIIKHKACGFEWERMPRSLYAKQSVECPECRKHKRKMEFIQSHDDLRFGGFKMIGDYPGYENKTEFYHVKCDTTWKVSPRRFAEGKRCPYCKQSKGERKISKQLSKMGRIFEAQKRFDTCKNKNPLPFDFYVNGAFLIEFDGKQHYESVDYFGGDKAFKSVQLRDNIKTQWAKDNGIPLVRIPYTEFDNIEQIVSEAVNKYCKQEAA